MIYSTLSISLTSLTFNIAIGMAECSLRSCHSTVYRSYLTILIIIPTYTLHSTLRWPMQSASKLYFHRFPEETTLF